MASCAFQALGLSVRKVDNAYDTWCGNMLYAHIENVKVRVIAVRIALMPASRIMFCLEPKALALTMPFPGHSRIVGQTPMC